MTDPAHRLDAAMPLAASDEALLRRIRDGETSAWQHIYERHAAAVVQRLWRLCGDEQVARDLTQDTFIIALRRVGAWHGRSSVASWLHGIAYNLLREHRRAHRRRTWLRERWLSLRAAAKKPSSSGAVTPLWGEEHLVQQLDEALAELDLDKRDAFVLRVIEGLSLEDASAVLGVPVSTVSYRARQAEARLRAFFGEEQS